jgi:hypothetical protein
MALKILTRPTFRHKVTAQTPIDGGHRPEVFFVKYQLASKPDADLSSDPLRDDFLRDVVIECEDLVDEAGNTLPWSDEVRDAVFALPWARMAILTGYFAAITGAKAKN